MNQFQFDTITADQAMNLEPDDVVIFSSGSANAASVVYGATANNISTVTISIGGHSVVFGIDVQLVSAVHNLRFPDGSLLVIGGIRTEQFDGGDSGADTLLGGQGDDLLVAGSGDDFLSGDRGGDTVTGGAGADTFHVTVDGSVDRITDFHIAEGDRVQLDAGTMFQVMQMGA